MTAPYVHSLNDGQLIRFSTIEINEADTYSEKYVNRILVKAPLPETLSLSVQNEVNQLFSIFQLKGDLTQLVGFTGVNVDRGFSQREYWRGPENADISVELHFNAYYSGYVDVMVPVQNLLLMAASRETSFNGGEQGAINLKVDAGLDEIWAAPSKTVVRFGNYFMHKNIIIKSVEVSYSNKLDADFNPMSAVVNVTMVPADPMGFAVMHGGSEHGGMRFNDRDAVSNYEKYRGHHGGIVNWKPF